MCRACVGWASMNDLIHMDMSLNTKPDSFKKWYTISIICLITSKYDNGDYFHTSSNTNNTSKNQLASSLLDRYIEWKRNNPYNTDIDNTSNNNTTNNNNLYKHNPSPNYVLTLDKIYGIKENHGNVL